MPDANVLGETYGMKSTSTTAHLGYYAETYLWMGDGYRDMQAQEHKISSFAQRERSDRLTWNVNGDNLQLNLAPSNFG